MHYALLFFVSDKHYCVDTKTRRETKESFRGFRFLSTPTQDSFSRKQRFALKAGMASTQKNTLPNARRIMPKKMVSLFDSVISFILEKLFVLHSKTMYFPFQILSSSF
ncbi:hypothetical protein CEXT_397731 [Caerostris extrusa]|uniref:Uncharacterized protein n=1 Tax=Caerostris extrusa TaxID=172846 RepID=A0AAV4XQY9_CAEEX|nr:hypothetical protein CEXT_397731 [Caerostris extrusa]